MRAIRVAERIFGEQQNAAELQDEKAVLKRLSK